MIHLARNLNSTRPMRLSVGLLLALWVVAPLAANVPVRQGPPPTFKAGVDRVTVTAVVHRQNGQPVTDLRRDDFSLLDNGRMRPILEFRSEPTAATLALLVDLSGSMAPARMAAGRQTAEDIVGLLARGIDRVGLFAFDTRLHELRAFEPVHGDMLEPFDALRPFGATSLYDAVAAAGRRVAADGATRRAVVALTDGGENSSRLSATDVTRLASEIDVPVYIVVVSPFEGSLPLSKAEAREAGDALMQGRLGTLAHTTGGEIFSASSSALAGQAARQIVDELRQQYFIGFAPDTSRPGWHSIEVRTHRKDLVVRARSGYVAQDRPDSEKS